MLGKLIKHDFRAFARTLLPLQLGVLGGGLIAAILTRVSELMMNLPDVGANEAAVRWTTVFSVLFFIMVGVLLFAVGASALVSLVMICIRVQKSFFGDEGYMTFSLPTTTGRLLWSKIITGTLWLLISFAAVALSIFLFALFGTAQGAFVNAEVWRSAGGLFQGFGGLFTGLFSAEAVPGMWLMAILAIADVLAYLLLQIMLLYFAVIAGGMASRKHKLLAAIGIYLVAHFVLGILLTVCGVIAIGVMAVMSPVGAAWLALIGVMIGLGGLCAALFFWSRHLLKDRLNLQ